jgi:peptide/nickel transport system substrate-binding protein
MLAKQKKFRYLYWIALAFVKNNIRPILLSFFLTVMGVISIISISPYLLSIATTKKEVIGMVGTYEQNELPDTILSKISNSLLFINEKGEIKPVIAEYWEQTSDGKEYRFHIRKNLMWNDGKNFSAKDTTYNFKDIETKVEGDNLIIFKLKKPLPIFPTYLTRPIIKDPLTGVAGLYKVERIKFKPKEGTIQELNLTPNKPNMPVLIYKFYDTETKLVNAYKLGEINQFTSSKKTIVDSFSSWKNTKIDKVIDYSQLLTLFFNMNNATLKQKEVRQAIIQAISQDHFNDLGQQSYGPIPPISWAYNQNLKAAKFNPSAAEKVLKKMSESSGAAELTLNTYYDYMNVTDIIKEDLDKVGMKIKVNVLSYNQSPTYDMFLAYWKVPLDPDQYYFWHSTQKQGNITNYDNKRIDLLLEQGRNNISVDERKKIYNDFQRLLVDDAPAYFLYYPYIYTVSRN